MQNITNSQNFFRCFSKFIIIFLSVGFINISVADWVYKGLTTSTVSALVAKNGIVIAGTRISGVFISRDYGDSWIQTLKDETVWELEVFGDYILAGTYDHGVFVSKDNGFTWIHSNLNDRAIWSFAAYGNNILAGTGGYGMHLSSDNGLRWTNISNELEGIASIFVLDNVILAASQGLTTKGIYRSTNSGASWINSNFDIINVGQIQMMGSTLLAGTDDFNSVENGIYFSDDQGFTWGLTSFGNNLHVDALVVEGDTVFAGTYRNGIYVSETRGLSWVQKNEGLPYLPVPPNALSIVKINNYVFTGIQYNGIYRREIDELIGIQPVSTEIPNEFSLSQNYPNPFNPATTIEFSVPKQSIVSLKVYDIKGSLVEILVNENVRAGKYSVNFGGSKYGSGIYLYVLDAGDFRETKKMVLIK